MDKRGGNIELKRKLIESDANEQFFSTGHDLELELAVQKVGTLK